ncbi:unnamed protein product [Schistosoma curassoni]|uniref:Reverse transcriptase domain-containing protein n=1 Tax=Schistosoma curassoni TaxID=6186 RepID=A0A183K008_9TREM|nr:unnamed protein product [Schistosoma curassoni]
MQLDDLDFADDLALLSQTQQQMQEKTTSVAAASTAVGLNIHKRENKILRYNTACTNQITLIEEALEDVKTFTYLGRIIDEYGGSDATVNQHQGQHFQYKCQNSSSVCKLGELRKPSSRRYKCLLTVVYAKYFGSVGQTISATNYCEREQTRSQWRKKSERSAGSG